LHTDTIRYGCSQGRCTADLIRYGCTQGRCTADLMKLNTGKTRFVIFIWPTNFLRHVYKHCECCSIRTDTVKAFGFLVTLGTTVSSTCCLYFFPIKLLSPLRTVTYCLGALDCLFLLYFTLMRPKLENTSVSGTRSRLQTPKVLNTSISNLYPCVKTFPFLIKLLVMMMMMLMMVMMMMMMMMH
jgi:hypothetical protein